jgi:aspartate carbamoyltransferase catalytic subunit
MLSLQMLGATVRLVGPLALLPDPDQIDGPELFDDFEAGIASADVVMMLRVQRERIDPALLRQIEPDLFGGQADYHALYGLTRERLDRCAPKAAVMHPGPMNRGIEIEGDLADDRRRSAILDQVENGVAVRMACLDLLTRERRDGGA